MFDIHVKFAKIMIQCFYEYDFNLDFWCVMALFKIQFLIISNKWYLSELN